MLWTPAAIKNTTASNNTPKYGRAARTRFQRSAGSARLISHLRLRVAAPRLAPACRPEGCSLRASPLDLRVSALRPLLARDPHDAAQPGRATAPPCHRSP